MRDIIDYFHRIVQFEGELAISRKTKADFLRLSVPLAFSYCKRSVQDWVASDRAIVAALKIRNFRNSS
jgi:hypothetical protein